MCAFEPPSEHALHLAASAATWRRSERRPLVALRKARRVRWVGEEAVGLFGTEHSLLFGGLSWCAYTSHGLSLPCSGVFPVVKSNERDDLGLIIVVAETNFTQIVCGFYWEKGGKTGQAVSWITNGVLNALPLRTQIVP